MAEQRVTNNSVFPSESVNFAEPLTPDEQQLLSAFRVNNKQRVMEIALGKVLHVQPESDVAEQLAMFIIGSLALKYGEFSDMLKNDDRERLHLLWVDVAAAIREGLPRLDKRELINIHDGK